MKQAQRLGATDDAPRRRATFSDLVRLLCTRPSLDYVKHPLPKGTHIFFFFRPDGQKRKGERIFAETGTEMREIEPNHDRDDTPCPLSN